MSDTTKRNPLVLIGAGIIAVAVSFFGVSAAGFALVPALLAPAGVAPADPYVNFEPAPVPTYEVNQDGLTFGSAAKAISPETEPDLISVVASNGREGYVLKAELDAANGQTAWTAAKTDEERVKSVDERAKLGIVQIAVYESDGRTLIGTFPVAAGGQSAPRDTPPPDEP